MSSTGDNIKCARIKAGLPQWRLADKLGVTEQTISSYEAGRQSCGIFDICRIAPILKTTPYELIHGVVESAPDVLHLPSRATAITFHIPAW